VKQTDVSEARTAPIIIAPMMETISNSETLVYFNKTKQRVIPKGCHLHTSKTDVILATPSQFFK
jgi:hypothetical protein